MIDPSLFIHPSIAIPATSLVLAAFVLKARKRKYYREHYAVAMAAFILTAVAIPIGLRAVLLSYARFMTWPLTLIPHLGMATISAILISVQSGLGITMLMRKKSRKSSLGLYRVHSRLGKFVAASFCDTRSFRYNCAIWDITYKHNNNYTNRYSQNGSR